MNLSTAATDRLFDILSKTYGTEFQNKWSGMALNEIKSHWAFELGSFADNLNAIGWALKNLPDRCPNLIEFKSLCKQAPRPTTLSLDEPKAPLDVVDKELAKMAAEAFRAPRDDNGTVDHKRWAKKLKARHDNGEVLGLVQVRMYKEALECHG